MLKETLWDINDILMWGAARLGTQGLILLLVASAADGQAISKG